MSTYPGLSKRIKTARQWRGLTQLKAAERAGIAPSLWSHYESGKRDPSAKNLSNISISLEVTADYLLGTIPEIQAPNGNADSLYEDFCRLSEKNQDLVKWLITRLTATG